MGFETPDNDWEHLYPDFRDRLRALFAGVAGKGLSLVMAEGFRSVDRQRWLYGQGRPGDPYYHPGPVVTDMKVARWHGTGLAADCYPSDGGAVRYDFTTEELTLFRTAMKGRGLSPTSFPGDYGHTQLNADDVTRQKAVAWVKAGFRDPVVAPAAVRVTVNGVLLAGTGAYLDADSHVRAWVRPIADAIKAAITQVTASEVGLQLNGIRYLLPVVIREGHAFIRIADLAQFPSVTVGWNTQTRTAMIST